MSEQQGQEKLTSLSDTLNKLAKKGLSQSETAEQRANLAALASNFNDIAVPALPKILPALFDVSDYSSRWIMAKMLRDAAIKDPSSAGKVIDALYTGFAKDGDADMRQMSAGIIRDVGSVNEDEAVHAASIISNLIGQEKSSPAKNSEKNALMGLAIKYEAPAPIVVCAIGKAMLNETESRDRVSMAQDLSELGVKYPSQSGAVIRQIVKAALIETEGLALQRYAEKIATVALSNAAVVPAALMALSDGYKNTKDLVALSGYSRALTSLGQQHPAAALSTISQLLESGGNKDQRRLLVLSLTDLAEGGGVRSTASATILMRTLSTEEDAFNRRLIVTGLMAAARNGNDEGDSVKEALKIQLNREKDPETYRFVEKNLRSLGYVKPFTSNVVGFQPGNA